MSIFDTITPETYTCQYCQKEISGKIAFKAHKDKCGSNLKRKEKVKGCVYFLKAIDKKMWKIGKSKTYKRRISWIKVQMPFKVEVKFIIPHEDIDTLELNLHNHFKDKNLNGEWFDLDEEDIEWVKENYETRKEGNV